MKLFKNITFGLLITFFTGNLFMTNSSFALASPSRESCEEMKCKSKECCDSYSDLKGCSVFCGLGMFEGLMTLKEALLGSGIPTNASLTVIILFWVKVFLVLAGTLAFVAFVWAGFLYITSFINAENPEKAKKIMLYTIIGILVIIFSYSIVNYFMNIS